MFTGMRSLLIVLGAGAICVMIWLRWSDGRTIDQLTGQLKAQKAVSETLKKHVKQADDACADLERRAVDVALREQSAREQWQQDIAVSRAEAARLKRVAEEARKTYQDRTAIIPTLDDVTLARETGTALTELYGSTDPAVITPAENGFTANRQAIATAMSAAVEALFLRGGVGNRDDQLHQTEEREAALTDSTASLTKELRAANDARSACLTGIATMRQYQQSLEDQLKTVAERDKMRTRKAIWSALTPRLGIGIAAGIDVSGKPNAVAGITLGWTWR